MPILVDNASRVLFQGISSDDDIYQMQQCIAYGTKVVGGIYSQKKNQELLERPMFGTVREAAKRTGCDVVLLFNQPKEAKEALLEAIYASISLIVCMCDEVPLHDMVEVLQALKRFPHVRLLGPRSSGLISPGQCKAGLMPGYIFKEGSVGILSSSSTLMYEAVLQTTKKEIGQSTCVVQGVYPLIATSTVEILDLFYRDVTTEAIMLLGEIDPTQEKEIIEWVKRNTLKPLIAFVTGQEGTNLKTRLALAKAGVLLAENISLLGEVAYKAVRPLA